MINVNSVLDGLMGLCVGDALGVPVEFLCRSELKSNPVKDMLEGGFHLQEKGTWSDDSSLTFCLAESLCNGYNIKDISKKFIQWYNEGYWTPHGIVFDAGFTTITSIQAMQNLSSPIDAGGKSENCNGNGALMRILPLAFYLKNNKNDGENFTIIHDVTSLTHAHPRSKIASSIYVQYAINLLLGMDRTESYKSMQKTILNYYSITEFSKELEHFKRILCDDISKLDESQIESSGYVINTLEASLWCLLNYNTYKDSVLTAVNLGQDTDTTAAVTGGLAGIYFGYKSIPESWINVLARKDDIIKLATDLNNKLLNL